MFMYELFMILVGNNQGDANTKMINKQTYGRQ